MPNLPHLPLPHLKYGSSLVLPSLVAAWALATLDIVLGQGPTGLRFLFAAWGLTTVCALVQSAALTLGLSVLPQVHPVGRCPLPAAALALGLWLAQSLGVPQRLQGPYRHLAMATGLACLLGALLAAVGFILLQVRPSSPPPTDQAFRIPTPTTHRHTLGLGLGLLALGSVWADRQLYVGLYPAAHQVLRICGALCITFALGMLWRWPGVPRLLQLALAVLAAASTLISLNQAPISAISAFDQRPLLYTLLQQARRGLDWDGDGFSALLGGGDCDDDNPQVHPSAAELPENGIDDNCWLGDAQKPPRLEPLAAPAPNRPAPSLNLVLITVDTLRWDRLGLNDAAFAASGRNTMPELSQWARAGVNFTRAYTPGSWTSIALPALLRGRYPRHLQWQRYYETTAFRLVDATQLETLPPDEALAQMFPLAWADPHPTLAEILQRYGMRTLALVDDDFTLMLARELGCASGFEYYRQAQPGAGMLSLGDDALSAQFAIAELRRLQQDDQPFFLWVHFFGPHGPSLRHEGVRLDGESQGALYDHEVRYLDQQLGKLLHALEPSLPRTAVFVTADHGESLFSTYRSHGTDLSEALIRVPLVARVPGWRPGTFSSPVSLVDLVPTTLSLLQVPRPAYLDGVDLGPAVQHQRALSPRVLFSDNWRYDRAGNAQLDSVSAYNGRAKLVLDRRSHSFSSYLQHSMPEHLDPAGADPTGSLYRALRLYTEEALPMAPTAQR